MWKHADVQHFHHIIEICFTFTTMWKHADVQLENIVKQLRLAFTTMWKHADVQLFWMSSLCSSSFTTMWKHADVQPQTNGITDYWRILTSSRMKKVWFYFICTFGISAKVRETTLYIKFIIQINK